VHKLLALETSPDYAAVIEALLEKGDFEVTLVADPAALRDSLQRGHVDVCIVSYPALPRPNADLRVLRGLTTAPILALVDDAESSKNALSNGADYDLAKPFDPEHFLAAVQAVLRRGESNPPPPSRATVAGLVLDPESRSVERNGERQRMSEMEWQLFAYMVAHPGQVLAKRQLAEGAWGPGYSDREGQAELYISRVRHKIEADPTRPRLIETVRGRGYRLNSAA
jgi:DNA-binding response OmpR family regulator